MNNRYQGKPEVYDDHKVGTIYGDIIKPAVEEKPTFERIVEMMKKRYRGTIIVSAVDAHLKEATIKEAFDKILAQHVRLDGHERNIILTPEELVVRQRNDNIKGVVGAIATVLKGSGDHRDMIAAVSRQVAMRKMRNVYSASVLAESIIRKLKDEKIIALKLHTNTKTVWTLANPKAFVPENYEKFVAPYDLI